MRIKTYFLRLPLLIMGVLLVFTSSCSKDDENDDNTFKDPRDNKVYKTVIIGNQVWMAENLAYKPSGGIYWAYNNNNSNVGIYGYLYDWETAVSVCPPGWHLPGEDEWTELTDYLGGANVAGGKLKATGTVEAGTGLWRAPNTGATNETGFTALPGGVYNLVGNYKFSNAGFSANWWSANGSGGGYARYRAINNNNNEVYWSILSRDSGMYVRCLKD